MCVKVLGIITYSFEGIVEMFEARVSCKRFTIYEHEKWSCLRRLSLFCQVGYHGCKWEKFPNYLWDIYIISMAILIGLRTTEVESVVIPRKVNTTVGCMYVWVEVFL